MRRFRYIDHTADAGIQVYGRDRAELFRHAAEGFFHILTDPNKIVETESREISLEAGDLEELLVRWLSEFLFLFDTEGLLFRRFDLGLLNDHHLQAEARGEPYDEGRHPIKTPIKAVTYHRLRVRREGGVWKAEVIFDL